jgi:hypothetical protein
VQYLVIEHFKDGDPVPVYRRFRAQGRLLPEGVRYVASWVSDDLARCYQIMETAERALLEQWIAAWSDLIGFEVIPVLSSAEVQERLGSRLASQEEAP